MKRLVILTILSLATSAQAAPPIAYERIVAFFDPLPDGAPGELFGGLGTPELSGDNLVFLAISSLGKVGVYCYCDGGLRKVVAEGDPSPRGETIEDFDAGPSLYGGEVVFVGVTLSSTAIFRWEDGALFVVADHLTPIPNGAPGETFPDELYWQPTIDENGVVFYAEGETTKGIYRQRNAGGPIEVVIDIHTENPWVPGETFHGFNVSPFARNGSTVFSAGSPSWGGLIRDSGMGWAPTLFGGPLPGGLPGEVFHSNGPLARLSAGLGSLVFSASGDMGTVGWYRERNGTITVEVDNHTINPQTGEPFQHLTFNPTPADGNQMAFKDGFPLQRTLFLRELDGTFVPIITEGEVFDGDRVILAQVGRGSLSGNRLGFHVLADASEAIYVATVGGGPSVLEIPTLGRPMLVLLALLLSGVGLIRLRR